MSEPIWPEPLILFLVLRFNPMSYSRMLRTLGVQGNFYRFASDFHKGKSHAFLWAQNMILHEKKDEFNSCSYFINSLKTQGGKFSFYRAFQEYVVNQSDLVEDLSKYRNTLHSQITKYKEEYGKPADVNEKVIMEEIFKSPSLINLAHQIYVANDKDELVKNDGFALEKMPPILLLHEPKKLL